jgi:enamine deaminase RidA (YjgF/YER057c/UK114 family)
MPAGNNSTVAKPGSRLRELGLVLPKPPSPLGAYVEASQVGSLLFLSGTLPLVNRKLAISGRLGANLSVDEGREAARLAALNALAAAQEHVGDLDRLKKLVKLSVLILTTEEFVEHASVADGASNLFVQLSAPRWDTSASCTVCTARLSAHPSWSTPYLKSNRLSLRRILKPMSKWTETEIARRLNICYPIQGPFGRGGSSALTAATVSNAGGLGSYGANDQGPAGIIKIAADIRKLTDKPFGLSLSVFSNQDQACQSNNRNH